MSYGKKTLSLLLLFIVAIPRALQPTFAESELVLTLETDKSTYFLGELVKIYGTTKDVNGNSVANVTISIEVRDPRNNTMFLDIVYSSSNGSYKDSFRLPMNGFVRQYNVFVTANKTGYTKATKETSFYATKITADFNISALPSTQTINPGQSIDYTVIVNSISGFSSPVSLSGSVEPASTDISLVFNPQTITPPSDGSVQSTLTISTISTVPIGTYTITITGTGEEKAHLAYASLIVGLPSLMFKISNIFAPLSVSVSKEFYISVITSYSFITQTNVRVGIWNSLSNKQIAVTDDALLGDGIKVYNFKLIASASKGTMKLLINAYYEQNGTWNQEIVGGEHDILINIVEKDVPTASFRVTQVFFKVEYKEKIYKAFLAENLTAPESPPSLETINDILEWMYSKFNWYIVDDGGNLVADEFIYLEVAFAAQMALQGISTWLPQNLKSRSSFFIELMTLGTAAEICRRAGSIAAGMIPHVVTGGLATATKLMVTLRLMEGVNRGITGTELLFNFMITSLLGVAADYLKLGAELIEPTYNEVIEKGFPSGLEVQYDVILQFYDYVRQGEILGYSAMRALSERHNEGIWGYLKDVVMAATMLKTAEEIVDYITSETIISEEFRVFWEQVEKMDAFYDVSKKLFRECAKNFWMVFSTGESFVALISTQLPTGEQVNLLVSTNSTMLSKFISLPEKTITLKIDGSEGTIGALWISIPKSLLSTSESNIEKILVTVDGKVSTFIVEEQSETYILHVNYIHSQHTIKIHYLTYALNVKAIGSRSQPLCGSQISLIWNEDVVFNAKRTDANGYAYFDKVPIANFTVKAEYKGLCELQTISMNETKETIILVDVFIEPFGVPFTKMQTLLLSVFTLGSVGIIVFVFIKRHRKRYLGSQKRTKINKI